MSYLRRTKDELAKRVAQDILLGPIKTGRKIVLHLQIEIRRQLYH